MHTALLTIHIILAVLLIGIVLMQRSEGGMGSMGGGGGGGSFMSARGTANALTRGTAILAFLFMCTNIGLTIVSGVEQPEKSTILDLATQQQSLKDEATSKLDANGIKIPQLPVPQMSAEPKATDPDTKGSNATNDSVDAKAMQKSDTHDAPVAPIVPEVPVVTE